MITGDQTYLLLYATMKTGVSYKVYAADQLHALAKDLADIEGSAGLLFAKTFVTFDAKQLVAMMNAPTVA